jgi:hypothetical protein
MSVKKNRRKKPMRIKKIRAGDIDPRLSSTFNPGGSRYGGIDPTRKMGRQEGGLVGGQTKLDMNKDGMITGQDFKMMPKKYGGKITYRMSGGKVASAGYDD